MKMSDLVAEMAQMHAFTTVLMREISTSRLQSMLRNFKQISDSEDEEIMAEAVHEVTAFSPKIVLACLAESFAQEIANRLMNKGVIDKDL